MTVSRSAEMPHQSEKKRQKSATPVVARLVSSTPPEAIQQEDLTSVCRDILKDAKPTERGRIRTLRGFSMFLKVLGTPVLFLPSIGMSKGGGPVHPCGALAIVLICHRATCSVFQPPNPHHIITHHRTRSRLLREPASRKVVITYIHRTMVGRRRSRKHCLSKQR